MILSGGLLVSWVPLTIGTVAVLANSLLIWTARRLQHYTLEIKLALVLASVDMALAIVIMCSSILNNWQLDDDESFQVVCGIKDIVCLLLLFASLALVAMIALERYYKARGSTIPACVWALVGVYTGIYIVLVAVVASRSEISSSLVGYECVTLDGGSVLSNALVSILGLSVFGYLALGLSAYLRILKLASKAQKTVQTPQARHTLLLIRIASNLIIYVLLITPLSLLIILEGSGYPPTAYTPNTLVTTLVALLLVANPCLVLFSHSLMFEQLILASSDANPISLASREPQIP
ncbi:hypothetical protein DSO57_1038069 [Entomophthora muscae]|uniref:Uncharacterized protein n=1 Tax=Entomophthora muscae TaxID=34485 RepID=A0ACC2RDH9_9FUNG|nr:hypothetical protein DSO57_1038069 [Entomophthora muscae]